MLSLEPLQQKISEPRSTGDSARLRNTLLDVFADFGQRATDLLGSARLRRPRIACSPNGVARARSAPKGTCSIASLCSATLVTRPRAGRSSRARDSKRTSSMAISSTRRGSCRRRSCTSSSRPSSRARSRFPPIAPPEALQMAGPRRFAIQQAENAACVRGMRLLAAQGDFESEAGGLDRAVDAARRVRHHSARRRGDDAPPTTRPHRSWTRAAAASTSSTSPRRSCARRGRIWP